MFFLQRKIILLIEISGNCNTPIFILHQFQNQIYSHANYAILNSNAIFFSFVTSMLIRLCLYANMKYDNYQSKIYKHLIFKLLITYRLNTI